MLELNSKPDLEDGINVTDVHEKLVNEAAACVRENRIVDTGIAPISLWAILLCGIVLLIAGAILGESNQWFSYDSTFREGYVRSPASGMVDTSPVTKDALAAYMAKGSKIYSAKCNGCHGADAKGNGSTYPSLVGSSWVTGHTERFAMIILNGLQGPVSSGTSYGIMPPQGIGMSPEDLAGVMTFVRNNFGNAVGDVITTDMAKFAIDVSSKRKEVGKSATAAELDAEHLKALVGNSLDPTTKVDPVIISNLPS
jgi:mono/diheme cytochrome c family protein